MDVSRGVSSHWANTERSRNRRNLNVLVSARTLAIIADCSIMKRITKRVQSGRLRLECAPPATPVILSGNVHSTLGMGHLSMRVTGREGSFTEDPEGYLYAK